MQDPNEDTEWNDALRRHGIIPEKPKEAEITEEDIMKILDETIKERDAKDNKPLEEMGLDELLEKEDDEDERVLAEYRRKRMEEMKAEARLAHFGDVREISAIDYVQQVNEAGPGVWVVLHLYKPGIPLCSLINQYVTQLAVKFPKTKFLKSVSTTCVPNLPDKHLPTVFIYCEGQMRRQLVGPLEFGGMGLTQDALEWILHEIGALVSALGEDPRPRIVDVMEKGLFYGGKKDDSDSENDW